MNNSLAEVHPELVSEWSEKNLTLTPDDITFGSNKKVWWRGACGHEWQTSVKARSNGEKCPICSGARVIAGINDLATLEPLLAKQWSKKNKIKPTEVSIGSHKKVIWRCEKGHEWEAAVKSRTINKTGCPYCSHNKVLAGFNDLATLLPDIAAEWSDRNYPLLPTQVTVFANRKAWWKCKDCGNIVEKVKDKGVPVICCGEPMQELKAGVTDAAVEKHVPVYTIEGSHVHVMVGETKHPMLEEHFIEWITLNTNQGIYRKQLNPGQEPVADFCLCDGEQVEEVYAYCNLHGLWKC